MSSKLSLFVNRQPAQLFCQKLQGSKWTDAIILVNFVAALTIGILASLNFLNSMGSANAVYLSMAMYGLAATWLIIELAKVAIGCSRQAQSIKKTSHGLKNSEATTPQEEDAPSVDIEMIDKVFVHSEQEQPNISNELINSKEKTLEGLPLTIKTNGITARTQEEISRAQLTIEQLNSKYQIAERDGTTWGFDTVLLRGVHLPDARFDTKSLFETSMTTIINKTFMEGMKGNGYMYTDEGPASVYNDELIIEKRHNWLVSTTFQLSEACYYASPEVESTGMLFFLHAPQDAMKNELFGVNLCGGGKKTIQNSGEVGFVFVPPEYILGAIPVTRVTDGWSTAFQFHKSGFVANPNAHLPVKDLQNIFDFGLVDMLADKIEEGTYVIVNDGYHVPDVNPHLTRANEEDQKRLSLAT
jgi:hypothetical protein